MDLSAVIFVAVAVAWAVYLVPKALRHHDEAQRSRSVDRYSPAVRVRARREAVSGRDARLVVPQRDQRAEPQDDPTPPTAAEVRARRMTVRRATTRRRRVLGALLVVTAVVATLAVLGVVAPAWTAAPAGLLVAWLVACRVMVRGEQAAWVALTATAPLQHRESPARPTAGAPTTDTQTTDTQTRDAQTRDAQTSEDGSADTDELSADDGDADDGDADDEEQRGGAVAPAADASSPDATPRASAMWDPVPVTLPTYVHKNTAIRRSVRTIDLDATGVWTSGRTDEDARIAQASAKRVARSAGGDGERAVGS